VPSTPCRRRPARPAAARNAVVAPRPGTTLAAAVGSPAFWWLAAMRVFGSRGLSLVEGPTGGGGSGPGGAAGAPRPPAAPALGAVSLVSLAGRLTTGVLCDRIGRAPALTLTYTLAALGVGCLAALGLTGASWWLVPYVALYGMAQGSSGMGGGARAVDLFGGASFGAIWGWITLAVGPGEALGVWLGGRSFDVWGSYLPAFGFVWLALAAGV